MVRERHRVFVKSGVTAEITEEVLQRHFASYGSVIDVYIPKVMPAQTPKGFAYISFDCEESVQRAVIIKFINSPPFSTLKNCSWSFLQVFIGALKGMPENMVDCIHRWRGIIWCSEFITFLCQRIFEFFPFSILALGECHKLSLGIRGSSSRYGKLVFRFCVL